MGKIIIYCESDKGNFSNVSYELISKALELKKQAKELKDEDFEIICTAISSVLSEESIKKAYSAGAQKVVLIKDESFMQFNQIIFASAFVDYFNSDKADIILFPATLKGRMLAPRITTILQTGLVADCTELEFIVKDDVLKLASTRPTFGAELMATILSKKSPECATLRPKTFCAKFGETCEGEYVEFVAKINLSYDSSGLKLVREEILKKDDSNSFENAKIVLAAGFGLYDGAENIYIKKLQNLAKIIGAKFACTRKLVDYNAVPYDFQIGQTGSSVSADLYIAFGISGAIQHIQGMKNSKTIVSINTDENAEIFKYSDYKIIADAKTLIDELLKKFEK